MASSKLQMILEVIKGTHVMGDEVAGAGLRDYHAARAARDALRIRSPSAKMEAIERALKNYRVNIAWVELGDHPGHIRIECRATGDKVII